MSKTPEVRETQVLGSPEGSENGEEKGRRNPFPWLRSKDKQCSLDKGHKHGWKPLTMSASVLFSFAFASLILAVIIEVLAQQSKRNGGLALSPSINEIPTYAKFGYLFLPTIIAVIYSLLWGWIDLDVKRMQPWLEMSRPEGAIATRSIFLDYPYDFAAFIPIRAAKKRHWAVFYSATILVMIFLLITPLQSAILGSGSINVRREVVVSGKEILLPPSEQIRGMDTSIINDGYAITWLNQPWPPYTTPEYTLLPFEVSSDTKQAASTNWTGATTKYWTQLKCWPADMRPGRGDWDFLDGRGCNASSIAPSGSGTTAGNPFKMQYIGYHNSAWADYWLSVTCSKAAEHEFLAIWTRGPGLESTNPIEGSIVPLGPREVLPTTEFNSSAFEHLLGAGVSSTNLEGGREFPFGRLLEQLHQVEQYRLMWPLSPMVGFAIGTQNVSSIDEFRDHDFLGNAYNDTHKMLFSLAFRRMLANSSTETTDLGAMDLVQHGIIVSRLFSAVVEGLLCLVALLTTILWWHGKRAPSRLKADPASLGSLMTVCQNSSTLLDKFSGKSCLPDDKLQKEFEEKRFQLICGCQNPSGETIIKIIDAREDFAESQRISLPEPEPAFSMGHYSPIKPLALRREIGLLVILSMIGAVVALVYLKLEELRIGGLIRPTTNFEVLQILENYIPTVFATLLEPFWVLVNRLLCILQPFKDLWKGQRSAKGSINARYTSVPPQFVMWRAAKSGHFALVAICLLALFSNLLAVGLGGLFNEVPVVVSNTRAFQQSMKPILSNEVVRDLNTKTYFFSVPFEMQFYISMNNVSQGTALPPWVTKDYYFQPFTTTPEEGFSSDAYTVPTRGFGVVPQCSALGTVRTVVNSSFFEHNFTRDGQDIPDCPSTFHDSNLDFGSKRSQLPIAPLSAETVAVVTGSSGKYTPCEIPLFLSWSRTSANITDSEKGEMETSAVLCEPVFTTSMFNVTVDLDGHVLEAIQTSEASSTLDTPDSTNSTDVIITYLNAMFYGQSTSWHNDSLSNDWMNYLLKILPGNADMLDPLTTPNITALIPSIEHVYRQNYALLLMLSSRLFENYTEPITIAGTERHTEVRIFMDPTALVISLTVLGLDIAVAIVLFGGSIKHFLPRLPTNIASLLAYVAPSRAVREYNGPNSLTNATFSFGRYLGEDGRAHVGIEMDPFVVPVKLSALRKGDTEPRTGLLRRVLGRRKPGRGEPWL